MSEKTDEKRIVWSRDGETFNDNSLAELLDWADLMPGDTVEFGTAVEAEGPFVDADDVLEFAGERAYDEFGECAEDYPDCTKEAKAELDVLLKDWFAKHASCNFWRVVDVQEHIITEQDFIDAGLEVPAPRQEQPA